MSSPISNTSTFNTVPRCAQIEAKCNMLGSLTNSLFFGTIVSSYMFLTDSYPRNRTARVLVHPFTLGSAYALSRASFVYTHTIADECSRINRV
jgi:hypothetical protein